MPRVAFTAKTRKYLGSLDAVESVTQYRICYSKEFRDDCMRRYAEGGSPAAIFREAGLDPKIIGYKRVERCIARWKAENAEKAAQEQEAQEKSHARLAIRPKAGYDGLLRLRPTDFVGCVVRCGGTWGISKCLRCYGLVAALACANWLVHESVCVNRLVRADWYEPIGGPA